TGAWGLGPAVAQAEVVPDRYLVRRDTSVEAVEPGRKEHLVVSAGAGPCWRAVEPDRVEAPCLTNTEASPLARLLLDAGSARGSAVELEWVKDPRRFRILQSRSLHVSPRCT